jgi:molybdopterin-binding protein
MAENNRESGKTISKESPQPSLKAGPEQLLYARILEKGMYFGLLILLITYAIYVSGLMSPYLPHAQVPQYWGLSVTDYLHEAKITPGWAWVSMVGYGDFLNFVGISILAGVSIVCFLSIVPLLWKSGDKVYAVLAVTEVIILTVAASGILGSGGH